MHLQEHRFTAPGMLSSMLFRLSFMCFRASGYLPEELGHRATHLHQLEPTHRSDH